MRISRNTSVKILIISAGGLNEKLKSGGTASVDEIPALASEGCELLFTESGHHKPSEICKALAECREVMPNVSFSTTATYSRYKTAASREMFRRLLTSDRKSDIIDVSAILAA